MAKMEVIKLLRASRDPMLQVEEELPLLKVAPIAAPSMTRAA